MAITWKLQGGTVSSATSLAALKLSGLVRRRVSLDRDEVTFRSSANIDSTALFAYADVVTLTADDGVSPVIKFVGQCIEVPRRGAGRAESTSYKIAGTWYYLEQLIFQQNWPTAASSTSRRALIVAGLSPSAGTRQNTKAFVQDVLDWVIGSGTGAVLQYTAASLPTGFNVPFTRLDCPTAAEALQHINKWQPDGASSIDYSTTPPTYNYKRRSAATTRTYALTDFTSIDLNPRYELQLDRIVIQYATTGSGGSIDLAQEVDPGGTTGREFGCAVFVIDNNFLPLASGLAAAYRAGLSTLQYSGTLVITERECSQDVNPGDVINITGGLTEWATMAAQVQEVVEDIDAGVTTITVGPPAHLQFDDFIEIVRIARNQSDQFGGTAEIMKAGSAEKNQVLSKDFNPAAAVPTGTEIATAIEDAYTSKPAPRVGDKIDLTIDSALRYTAEVHSLLSSLGTTGLMIVGFTVGGITRYAHVFPINLRRVIVQSLSVAATVPTSTEIATALVAAFTSTVRPHHGDCVDLTVGGSLRFRYKVDFQTTTATGLLKVAFTLSGRTWYAVMQQLGIYA